MNWIIAGKWLGILAAAITQIAIPLCNGEGLSGVGISAVIAAIVAAGLIHGGQVQQSRRASACSRARVGVVVVAMILLGSLSGCAGVAAIAGMAGGGAAAGGLAYWLVSQPWFANLCYYVGDEGALVAMANANRTIDQDTIGACALAVATVKTMAGEPASKVNAELSAAISKLPLEEQAAIQEAATILDAILPEAASTIPLTASEVNDIVAFLQGWSDGTTTCMEKLPADVAKKLASAREHIRKQRASHPMGVKVTKITGWFKA